MSIEECFFGQIIGIDKYIRNSVMLSPLMRLVSLISMTCLLSPFVESNHHRQSTFFECGLVSNEDKIYFSRC